MVRIGEPIRLGARRRMIQAAPSVVRSGNHRLNRPEAPDLSRIAAR